MFYGCAIPRGRRAPGITSHAFVEGSTMSSIEASVHLCAWFFARGCVFPCGCWLFSRPFVLVVFVDFRTRIRLVGTHGHMMRSEGQARDPQCTPFQHRMQWLLCRVGSREGHGPWLTWQSGRTRASAGVAVGTAMQGGAWAPSPLRVRVGSLWSSLSCVASGLAPTRGVSEHVSIRIGRAGQTCLLPDGLARALWHAG